MIPRGKKLYLCRQDQTILTVLNGVRTDSVNLNVQAKDFDTLTFTIDEYINVNGEQVASYGYDTIDVFLLVYLEDIGYYQVQPPLVRNDGWKEYKEITAYSLEKEWEQHEWVGLKVNTGDTDSLEQLATDNVDDLGFAKEFVTFYNADNAELSLMDLMVDRVKGWSFDEDDIDPLLWTKKLRIEEDNVSMYALATSVIAPKAECIFLFDTINKKVKAISKDALDSYTYDTNIFIGFRNLANEVNIDVDEDSVYTRMNVRGDDDLTFADINYGDTRCYNYSYFLKEPYMDEYEGELLDASSENLLYYDTSSGEFGEADIVDDDEANIVDEVPNTFLAYVYSDENILTTYEGMIPKVTGWLEWRDENRDTFISLMKQRASLVNDIYYIKYRVPDDGTYWNQWDNMTEDDLNENLTYYNALLTSLQISVDTSPSYDSDGNYIPWEDDDGNVDHDAYLALLYDLANGYGGYYTYYQIINYIIPNIEIAIENIGVADDDKTDYITDYETNFELYGIEELTAKKQMYQSALETLSAYSKSWLKMTDDEKAVYVNDEAMYESSGRSTYVEYKKYLGNKANTKTVLGKLAELQAQLDAYEEQLDALDLYKDELTERANVESWLTEDELQLLGAITNDTDYTNSNILTTSVDTTLTTLDRELELYEDAVDKLSELCEPQYHFTVRLDNLLNIEEFSTWIDNFEILNYFRLGIKDNYAVKLRMIGYEYNPCDITSDLQIMFSSMITSRSGRSDLTELINNENSRGSKNSISVGTGNSNTEREYVTYMLQTMMNSSLFSSGISNVIGGIPITANIDVSKLEAFSAGYISASKIDVEQITGDIANFMVLYSKYIDADVVVANSATFETLDTDFANVKSAIIGASSTETGIVINLSSANAVIDSAYILSLVAGSLTVGDLATHTATADQIVLISADGESPSIAFQNATQQFYDSDGNVRVQIGQDSNGDFNFIVVGEDGSTALFDSTGITQNGIPSNTIINNMIVDGTISESKLDFEIIEPNEYGGIDITNIYNGENQWYGTEYITFKQDIEDAVKYVELYGSNAFVQDADGNILPESITLTAVTNYDAEVGAWYIDDMEIPIQVIDDQDNNIIDSDENTLALYTYIDGNTITIPSDYMKNKTSIDVKVVDSTGEKYDIMTVYKVTDGAAGEEGETGKGISDVTPQFCISTSNTENNQTRADGTTSEWSTEKPTDLDTSEFIWMRYQYDYDDGTTDYSNDYYDSSTTGILSVIDVENRVITDEVWENTLLQVYDEETGELVSSAIKDAVVTNSLNINGINTTISETFSEIDENITTLESNYNVISDTTRVHAQTISSIKEQVDTNENKITDAVNDISELIQTSTTFQTTISDKISDVETIATQTSNGWDWLIYRGDQNEILIDDDSYLLDDSGETILSIESGTEYSFSENGIQLINGSIEVMSPDGEVTFISGGKITTNNISSTDGTSWINLASGTFNYGDKLIWDGTDLSVNGSITSTDGSIGGWTIDENSIYSGTKSSGTSAGCVTLMNTDTFTRTIGDTSCSNLQFAIGSNFGVTNNGVIYAKGAVMDYLTVTNGTFSGFLSAATGTFAGSLSAATGSFSGTLTSTNATLGGWTIDSNSIYSGTKSSGTSAGCITLMNTSTFTRTIGSTSRSSLQFAIGSNFGVTNSGIIYAKSAVMDYLTVTNGTFSGSLSAATGTFAGSLSAATGTFSGSLSAATGTFSGSLSAATGTFSGTITIDMADSSGYQYINIGSTYAGSSIYIASSYESGITTIGSNKLQIIDPTTQNYTLITRESIHQRYNGVIAHVVGGCIDDGVGVCPHSSDWTVGNFRIMPNSGSPYLEVTDYARTSAYGINMWSSDARLKDNIQDSYVNATDIINSIKHRSFIWKESGTYLSIGYVAQELKEVIPDAVFEVGEGELAHYQINANIIIPYLTKMLQEQDKRITELENSIKKLTTK